MKNIKNNKGFTLAELLIVIAIIAALVAIMIPTFSGQVEKARESADIANLRSAYAEATMQYLQDTAGTKTFKVDVTLTQKDKGFTADLSSLPFTVTNPDDADANIKKATFDFSDDKAIECTLSAS